MFTVEGEPVRPAEAQRESRLEDGRYREGRSNQGLKTGGYTEGKYMKSFPVPPLTTPRSKTQAAWLSSLGKISKELNYLGLLRAPSGMLVLPE